MKIHVLPSGPIKTIGYLLTNASLGEAILIDAPGDILEKITPLLAQEGCRLKELWLTHGHWDHTQDSARLKRELAVLIRAHRADQALIETPELMEKFMGKRLGLEPAKIDVFFTPGETLTAVGREFEVRHVPGHCAGNVLFYAAPLNGSTGATTSTAFVGDALFKAGVGRWDLQGGGFAVLAQSIRSQIYTLPDDTIVFPGHGPRTTVGEEKATNPYVPLIAAARPV